jgi:hypothetical protein
MAPQAADGFYLVNCTAPTPGSPPGTVSLRSGIAYYADMFANHNNQDEQPTSFVYTDSEGNTTWESESGQSESSFPGISAPIRLKITQLESYITRCELPRYSSVSSFHLFLDRRHQLTGRICGQCRR